MTHQSFISTKELKELPKENTPLVHPDPTFKDFLKSILVRTSLNKKHINLLIETEQDMIEWTKVFTTRGISIYNYELYETFGDATCNKIVVWYYKTRFPEIFNFKVPLKMGLMGQVDILTKLKSKGVSKSSFQKYSREMDFLKYIRGLDEEKQHSQSILEDTFEAFIGCLENMIDTKIGDFVGYGVCFTFMKTFLDKEYISLKQDDLYDSKSLLNIYITKLKRFVDIKFNSTCEKDVDESNYNKRCSSMVVIYRNGAPFFESLKGVGPTKAEAEKNAAKKALDTKIFERLEKQYLPSV